MRGFVGDSVTRFPGAYLAGLYMMKPAVAQAMALGRFIRTMQEKP